MRIPGWLGPYLATTWDRFLFAGGCGFLVLGAWALLGDHDAKEAALAVVLAAMYFLLVWSRARHRPAAPEPGNGADSPD
jgi:hypothetical protein